MALPDAAGKPANLDEKVLLRKIYYCDAGEVGEENRYVPPHILWKGIAYAVERSVERSKSGGVHSRSFGPAHIIRN
jgi:hypothetical protein